MTNESKDSPGDEEGASRGRARLRALRSEPGPGPSLVLAPSVAPRGNEMAGRRMRSAARGATSGAPPAFAAQRLAALAAKLATRISTRGWLRTYERWKRGEVVMLFQRRWLAFSMLRLRGELRQISHAEFIATAPWPAHGGDQ